MDTFEKQAHIQNIAEDDFYRIGESFYRLCKPPVGRYPHHFVELHPKRQDDESTTVKHCL